MHEMNFFAFSSMFNLEGSSVQYNLVRILVIQIK